MNKNILRKQITQIVSDSSGGTISINDLEKVNGVLLQAGYTSLAFSVLIVELEERFGINISPSVDPEILSSVDKIVEFVATQVD